MSRKYQGRHRALPVSPLQSARVALPALAAASLTVAAAGTAAATDVGQQTRTSASAGFQDTTQWSQSSTGTSRSTQRASVTKAKASAAAKAKNRAASAQKARVARDGQTRRAALGALAANDTSAETYTKPKPQPKPQPTPQQESAPTTRGSQVRTDRSARSTGGTQQAARTQTQTTAPRSAESSSGWVRALSGGSLSSGYGYRWGRMHSGIDYATPVGTPLRALNSGTVTAVGWYGGQGQRVVVRFDNGTEAHYAHMSSFAVSPGQRVGAGQVIGASGNTGNSTGPHLHLEIHVGGSPVNPAGWLSARGIL